MRIEGKEKEVFIYGNKDIRDIQTILECDGTGR